jgi:antirestriction protein ArdC
MRTDYAAEVTAKILKDMETGVLPWERPWQSKGGPGIAGVPMNATSGRSYRGINTLLLWIAGAILGTGDLRFLTFKQAKDAGGHVMAGAKGSKIYFFKRLELTGEDDDGNETSRTIPMLREYTVFHVSQVEGCNGLKGALEVDLPKLPDDVEEFIASLGARVSHGGDRAAYNFGLDAIRMPVLDAFKSVDDYRATLYHELTHWTAHKSRLDRPVVGFHGSKEYAREELIAELGGAFLCAEFGLAYQTQHASYLANWLEVLREDKRAIFQAAAKAQAAVDYMRQAVTAGAIAAAA